MTVYKEYTVTTKSLEATDSVWDDLLSFSGSNTIPKRRVDVANKREINPYNTAYFLTDEEAKDLKHDSRVIEVQDLNSIPIFLDNFQDSDFNKTSTSTGARGNWGLLRHTKTSNIFGTSTADPGGSYDYVLDGETVDIVIIDSGIQANHPEFLAPDGVTNRVQQIDWYTAGGGVGTMPTAHYTDYHGHGTHVAGTAAGKNFGWAKKANIYSIKASGLQGPTDPNGGIPVATCMDLVLGWHQNKGNNRPTVVNNSWGYGFYWHTDINKIGYSSDPASSSLYDIVSTVYRQNTFATTVRDTSRGQTGSAIGDGIYKFPARVNAIDSDVNMLLDYGIHVVNAAGNESTKADVLLGIDYDNYVLSTSGLTWLYNRGMSPQANIEKGFNVGSMGVSTVGSLDRKTSFSNSGPAINIYAAGDRIMSGVSNVNVMGDAPYFANSAFKQVSISGTSMAAPQITGLIALVIQAHPDWTPIQVTKWMLANAEPDLYTTNLDNDYNVTSSIHGGNNRVAYFPMNGQKNYQMNAS